MKRLLIIPLVLLALVACNKKETTDEPDVPVTPKDTTETPDTPTVVTYNLVALTYDATDATVTATPGDSVTDYVLQIWLVEDFKYDYGEDMSDAAVTTALNDYLEMCIEWEMNFPIFEATETTSVYEWFEAPYYGVEHIAMAASFNTKTQKIDGPVTHIRFTTPQK